MTPVSKIAREFVPDMPGERPLCRGVPRSYAPSALGAYLYLYLGLEDSVPRPRDYNLSSASRLRGVSFTNHFSSFDALSACSWQASHASLTVAGVSSRWRSM
jgi:hypothetical protein